MTKRVPIVLFLCTKAIHDYTQTVPTSTSFSEYWSKYWRVYTAQNEYNFHHCTDFIKWEPSLDEMRANKKDCLQWNQYSKVKVVFIKNRKTMKSFQRKCPNFYRNLHLWEYLRNLSRQNFNVEKNSSMQCKYIGLWIPFDMDICLNANEFEALLNWQYSMQKHFNDTSV